MLYLITLALVLIPLALTYFLTIWFDGAKFFIEYIKLLGLQERYPHIKNFLKRKDEGAPETYLEYIETYKDSFLTRLVTCPKCFSIWGAAGFYLLYVLGVSLSFGFDLGFQLLCFAPVAIPAFSFIGLHLYFKTKSV